jgi:hypothetical protein
MPALRSSILEPLWVQVAALLPARQVHHPLGCHRRRILDRIVFDKLVQVMVFGAAIAASLTAPVSALPAGADRPPLGDRAHPRLGNQYGKLRWCVAS